MKSAPLNENRDPFGASKSPIVLECDAKGEPSVPAIPKSCCETTCSYSQTIHSWVSEATKCYLPQFQLLPPLATRKASPTALSCLSGENWAQQQSPNQTAGADPR